MQRLVRTRRHAELAWRPPLRGSSSAAYCGPWQCSGLTLHKKTAVLCVPWCGFKGTQLLHLTHRPVNPPPAPPTPFLQLILIWIPVTLRRAEQQQHRVPSPSPNSDLAAVYRGQGLCINTGYISANMILACSQGLRGALIVWALTLTSTLTYPPHHSLRLPLTLLSLCFLLPCSPAFFLLSQQTLFFSLPSFPISFPISRQRQSGVMEMEMSHVASLCVFFLFI